MRTNPLKFSGARRRMNAFRVCRQGLTALTVVLALMACDKLLPTGGTGELVAVKIRTISIAGGAQNETVTRAGGGGENRIVSQPVIQDLGGGMLAEITVEEEVSALRDDPYKKLENNAKLRIVALKKGTSEIYSWADYTATSSGEFSKVAGNLHVVSGVKYDFICFSYNDPSSETNWPDPLSEGGTLGVLTVDNTRDFLYKKLTDKEFNATSNILDLTLEHQLAKVWLVLDAGSRSITSVANTIKISPVSTPAAFDPVTTGNALSGTAAGEVSFTDWVTRSAARRESSLRLLSTSGAPALTLPAEAIVVDNTLKSKAKSFTLPAALAVGSSYTIYLKVVKPPKFAVSNIYWDGDKLTFEPHSGANTAYAKYQGVYFKWGSLIGISPVGDYDNTSTGTVLYWPDNVTNRTWKEVREIDRDDIPYQDNVAINSTNENVHSLLNNQDFAAYKGDICNYIDQNYRMPTVAELAALTYSTKITASNITVSGDDAVAGRYSFAEAQCGVFTVTDPGDGNSNYVFPASGYRFYNSVSLNHVGIRGLYWGSSACGSGDAYRRAFSNSAADTVNADREYTFPVRCVLNE